MVINEKDVSVALLIENGKIVPCSESEAVYHCYLPTLDKAIIPCKINADFSTDPSRKHLTLDEKTKNSLLQVSNIFINILKIAINNAHTGKYKNIFSMFLNKNTLSKINFFLDEDLESAISSKKWLFLNNGKNISPTEYKLFPYSFDLDNSHRIRTIPSNLFMESLPTEVYENIDKVDEFISQFSSKEFSLDDITTALSSCDFVDQLNLETHTQLVTNVVRESKIKSRLNPEYDIAIDNILIKTDAQNNISIEEIAASKKTIDKK